MPAIFHRCICAACGAVLKDYGGPKPIYLTAVDKYVCDEECETRWAATPERAHRSGAVPKRACSQASGHQADDRLHDVWHVGLVPDVSENGKQGNGVGAQ